MRSFHRTVSVMAALSLVVAACGDDNGGGPDNMAPTANFEPPACDQLSCQFTDGSTDSDGSIASRSWTFENGTPATSTDQNPTVVFSAAGTYTVTLSVTDNEGATDDFELDVTVTGAPGNQAPTAAFTPDVHLGSSAPSPTAAPTRTAPSRPGPGTSATRERRQHLDRANPTHTYTVTELTEVTVTLTVTDNVGATGADHARRSTSTRRQGSSARTARRTASCASRPMPTSPVTLVSSDCELAGNTFKVTITPPGGARRSRRRSSPTGAIAGRHELPAPERQRHSSRGPIITAQLVSGGNPDDLELPPALRLPGPQRLPQLDTGVRRRAHGPDPSGPGRAGLQRSGHHGRQLQPQ